VLYTIRFVPQRNGVRPSVVVSVRRGVFKRILNKAMEVPKKYMFSGCRDPQTSADTLIWWRKRASVRSPRVLDALKDNNYSVSLPKL
jgi:hypothetical protein